MDFDILVRSNSLPIFVIPVQIHHVLGKIGLQIPYPSYANWKLQHFVILELQSFSFLQKLSSIVQSRFLSVNQEQS